MKLHSLPVGMLGTNCYLLCDETQGVCAIVDPGDWKEQILQSVQKSGCTPVMILLTHGHYDHHTAVRPILEDYPDLPVYIHRADTCPADTKVVHYEFPLLPEKNQRFYDEGDCVMLGSLTIHVLHTPGHSKGSVTLQVEDVLITGDTLFAGSCGRIDLPGGSGAEIQQSLRRLGELEGDFLVCAGHMERSQLSRERERNPYLKLALRA